MNDKLADLQQLISLSRAMLERAQSSSWEEVTQLEKMRRELLSAFFLAPVETELARAVSEGIRSIMAIDQDIMVLGHAEKLELEQVLRQMDQGKKAVKAYGS
jgi:hypothetical protein